MEEIFSPEILRRSLHVRTELSYNVSMVEVRGSNVGVASLRGVSCMAGPGISRKERRCGRKISQLRDGVVTSYTYDAADRLTGQQLAGAYGTYTMDSVGNITVKHEEGSSLMTMTYDAASRLTVVLQDSLRSTYTYDSNGNNTAINAGGVRTTLAYDYENRMRTYIEGANRTTYVYWADGLRRQQIVNGSAVTYVWDGSDYLQARGVSEVQTFETVNGQIVSSDLGGVERLLVPDPLGSVVKLLDASGNELYDAAYWPYGSVRSSLGVNDTPWGYAGTWGYHVDGSRRLYVRARVLDPVTGRWYTVDPLWPFEKGYSYSDLFPVQLTDPSGLSVVIGLGLVAGGYPKQHPQWNPGFWNRPGVIDNNNCYSYACDWPWGVPLPSGKPQPGDKSGNLYENFPQGKPSCKNIVSNALRDGLITPMPRTGCNKGTHKVCLYVTGEPPAGGNPDYHWYRQDGDGTWSDKPGNTAIQRCYPGSNKPVTNPDLDASQSGYPNKCGCFCAKGKR